MNERTKSTDITPKVRAEVLRRDNRQCVNCHSHHNLTMAHVFYNRSHGGLGVAENLVTLCTTCHGMLDNGRHEQSQPIKWVVESYLRHEYPNLDTRTLKYCKFKGFEMDIDPS